MVILISDYFLDDWSRIESEVKLTTEIFKNVSFLCVCRFIDLLENIKQNKLTVFYSLIPCPYLLWFPQI